MEAWPGQEGTGLEGSTNLLKVVAEPEKENNMGGSVGFSSPCVVEVDRPGGVESNSVWQACPQRAHLPMCAAAPPAADSPSFSRSCQLLISTTTELCQASRLPGDADEVAAASTPASGSASSPAPAAPPPFAGVLCAGVASSTSIIDDPREAAPGEATAEGASSADEACSKLTGLPGSIAAVATFSLPMPPASQPKPCRKAGYDESDGGVHGGRQDACGGATESGPTLPPSLPACNQGSSLPRLPPADAMREK